ncbi:MAG: Kelch repeat-containing protein [Solirubrobacterales bacterium]
MSKTTGARRTGVAILAALAAAALACGGSESPATRAIAIDSATQRWKPLRNAILKRTEVGAARIGRFIYVVGGFLPSNETTNAVERYDIRRNRWRRLGPMPTAVNHPAVTAHRGRLYVYGGYTDSSFSPVTGTLQRYDPRSGSWTELAGSPHPRGAAALAAVGGKLYAVGGVAGGAVLAELEVFDLSSRRWRRGPPMRVAREHIAATAAGGDVYVFGGRVGGENLRTAERYDPRTRRWRRLAPMRTARSGIAAVTVRGKPVVFGGEELSAGGSTIRPVELFDPEAARWLRLPGMRTPRHGLGGAARGRRVYSLEGGPSPGGAFSDRIEFLDLPRRLLR